MRSSRSASGSTSSSGRIDPLARAFAGTAELYDRARPPYAQEPVDWAWSRLGLGSGSTVLDLAAGTGKLSELLAPRAGALFAVEPLAEMRRLLEARAPHATALDGTAEQIPLNDGSVDAVFVGEAFHWFEGERALPEIHRVLRPGAGLAMLFNQGEWHEAQWAEALVARFDEVPQPDVRPENRPYTGVWRRAFETSDLFSPLEHRAFPHELTFEVEQFVLLVLSWSWAAALPPVERERLAVDSTRILREQFGDEPMRLPYRTGVYVTKAA